MSTHGLLDGIDKALHAIIDHSGPGTEINLIASQAHAQVHDLAALLSDAPEIRASL